MDSTAEANKNKTKQTNIISNNNKHHIKPQCIKKVGIRCRCCCCIVLQLDTLWIVPYNYYIHLYIDT